MINEQTKIWELKNLKHTPLSECRSELFENLRVFFKFWTGK